MNRFIAYPSLLAALTAALLTSHAGAQIPAFPGADGAAQYASGGRGGIVYHVTKLNSELDDPQRSAPGTLLYGLSDGNFPGGQPRTIVFDVAGVFHLGMGDRPDWDSMGNAWDSQSRQSISATDLTIAGESAPGPVIIMGGTLKPSGSNIVIRNITIAAGYGMKAFWEPPPKSPPVYPAIPTSFTMDAFDISGQNILLDHVDAFYGSDETISCNENANNLTVQYCSNAQGQNYNGHAYGHLLQPNTNFKISFLNNLDAHLVSRLPRVGTERTALINPDVGSINDFRNNVTYNWFGSGPGYAGNTTESPNQPSANNFINNFYLSGNGGDSGISGTQTGGNSRLFQGNSPLYTQAYVDGNRKDVNKDGDPFDDVATTAGSTSTPDFNLITVNPAAWDVSIGTTLSARAAFTNVLKHVGSRWWERDLGWPPTNAAAIGSNDVNERIIYEAYTVTGRIEAWADDPYDTNPLEGTEWRALWALRTDTNGVAPYNQPAGWDTDQDGMPGYWELEHGLDPNVAGNNNDFDADGYTDLEEYLNDVAAWPAPGEIVFTGSTNNRYAQIQNWRVTGVNVNISGIGNLPTSSPWQPSRYDTAIISNQTIVVDAVGQNARTLRLANNATLNIESGWLKVINTVEIGSASTATLNLSGGQFFAGTLTKGAGGTFNFTGGTLSADVVDFNLLNQGGAIAPGQSPGLTVVNGDLILQSGSSLQLELGAANTNDSDHLIVNGNLTLGGTMDVANLAGFGIGTYTLITYTGTLGGSLTLGSVPSGFGYGIDTSTPHEVRLVVVSPPLTFESIIREGSNIVMTGSGPSNEMYYLLAADDLLLPGNLWTPIDTNMFDGDGKSVTTNLFDSSAPQTYFRLRLP